MVVIVTERLIIEEAAVTDACFFQKLMNSSTWLQFIGDRGVDSETKAQEYICDNLIKSYKQNSYGLYKMMLKDTNAYIGICGLVKRSYLNHPDIGFALLPEYEGQGLGLEAARAVLADSKTRLSLGKILAITTAENVKSKALLHKIGLFEVKRIIPPGEEKQFLLFSTEGTP